MSAAVQAEAVRSIRCRTRCAFGDHAHHDRLLAVEEDVDALLDLLELAVTWGELDYSTAAVIPPREWPAFLVQHRWKDTQRCERLFALATDIALHSQACATAEPESHLP